MQNQTKKDILIPKDWKFLPFGEVFKFIQSLALSRDQLTYESEEDETYNIHYGDIHATYKTDILDFEKESRIPKIKTVPHAKQLQFLEDGDLIIADASEDYDGVAANVEIINIKGRKVTGGLHTFVARDNSGLTVRGFRTYILKNPAVTNELKKLATGSKVFGVSKTNLATLNVLIPTESEQHKINLILSCWNEAIDTLRDLVDRKERHKKAVMQQLLTGRVRFKEFKKMAWENVTVDQLFEVKGRVGWKGYKTEDLRNSGPLVLGAAHITKDFKLDLSSPTFISVEKYLESPEIFVRENDILFVQRGSLGQLAHVDSNIGEATINPSMVILKPKEPEVKYYYYYLCSSMIQNLVKTESSQTGVPMLTQKQIGNFRIHRPKSIDERIKISNLLISIDQEIDSLKSQLNHYIKEKQGLIQVLLTGKVRVKI